MKDWGFNGNLSDEQVSCYDCSQRWTHHGDTWSKSNSNNNCGKASSVGWNSYHPERVLSPCLPFSLLGSGTLRSACSASSLPSSAPDPARFLHYPLLYYILAMCHPPSCSLPLCWQRLSAAIWPSSHFQVSWPKCSFLLTPSLPWLACTHQLVHVPLV